MNANSMQPWYWRSLPLNNRTGSQVFDALFRPPRTASGVEAIATLLESPYTNSADCQPLARYSICAGGPRIINGQPQLWTPPVGEILPFLRRLLQRSGALPEALSALSTEHSTLSTAHSALSTEHFSLHAQHSALSTEHSSLPFTGGWLGWLGYDLAWEIEHLPSLNTDPLPFPVAYWYEPASFAVLDRQEQALWLAATEPAELDELQARLERNRAPEIPPPAIPNPPSPVPQFHISQTDYEAAVIQAKKYIRAGDIFQANLSLRFEARTAAESWAIYRALQEINPSPFASYWQTPWGDVISCSPERLVRLEARQAETRPIAGTRSRGVTPEQDRQQAEDLISNAKERAEHVMLVDLERNDLGRVCEWGSVEVNELLVIERYSHVMHLVSNVTGTLRPECDAADLIRAMFPGGTITGCPKVRCMEIIEELEPVRRSLFYGSCGYLDWRGNLDLNILIRTLLYAREEEQLSTVWGQVGAGIVADSDPEKEWYESLHKAQAQLAALRVAQTHPPGC